ncbi:hypothetical protein QYE76_056635 [Lolium multiflorum]|uniref:Uncharacterized protein n=1 Tax=Lolium multiflorum TaxID=4521 RepID=A0AAD8T211_LOLMU|nr:hypothetical protein QYE76_056635 [Lolium multiflorum]
MDMNLAAAAAGLDGGEGAVAAAGAAAGAGAAAPAGAVVDGGAGPAGADLGGGADAVAAAEREAAYKEIDALYEASQYVEPCEYNTDDDVDEDNFESYVQRQVKGFESRILKTVRRGRHACPFCPCKVKDGLLNSLEMHAMDTRHSAREWQGMANHEALARNPSKEIFSELDEINAQGPIFPRSFQKTNEEGPRGSQSIGRRGPCPGRAAYGLALAPLDLPFRLLKASVTKPHAESHDTENLPETPPTPIPSRGSRDRPAPAGEGNHLPEDSTPPWSPPV